MSATSRVNLRIFGFLTRAEAWDLELGVLKPFSSILASFRPSNPGSRVISSLDSPWFFLSCWNCGAVVLSQFMLNVGVLEVVGRRVDVVLMLEVPIMEGPVAIGL